MEYQIEMNGNYNDLGLDEDQDLNKVWFGSEDVDKALLMVLMGSQTKLNMPSEHILSALVLVERFLEACRHQESCPTAQTNQTNAEKL
jgi:hypothetical protein